MDKGTKKSRYNNNCIGILYIYVTFFLLLSLTSLCSMHDNLYVVAILHHYILEEIAHCLCIYRAYLLLVVGMSINTMKQILRNNTHPVAILLAAYISLLQKNFLHLDRKSVV